MLVQSGGYTNVKPTGNANLIQNLGIVKKVDASNGTGEIFGSGRSNDLPNIEQGYVWVGGTSDVPTQTTTSSLDVATSISSSYALTASYAENAAVNAFPFTGSAQITGSLGVTGSIEIQALGSTGSVVSTLTDSYVGTAEANKIVTLTQTEYDAIGTKDQNTLYVISGSFITGSQGVAGTSGTSGVNGTSGVDGADGTSGVTPTVSPFTGSFDVTGSLDIVGPVNGNVVNIPSAATVNIDLSRGTFFTSSIAGTTTVNFTNITAGITANVELDTSGTPVCNFGAMVKEPSGFQYTASAAGNTDLLSVVSFDGTTVYVVSSNQMI